MKFRRVLIFCVFSAGPGAAAAGPLCLLYEGSKIAEEQARSSHYACTDLKRRPDPFKDQHAGSACLGVSIGYKGCEATAKALCQAKSRKDTAMASCNEEMSLERAAAEAERQREREAERTERQRERNALDLAEDATTRLNEQRDPANPANALSKELTDTALGIASSNGRSLLDTVDETFSNTSGPRPGTSSGGKVPLGEPNTANSLLSAVDTALGDRNSAEGDLLGKVDRSASGELGKVIFEGLDVTSYDLFPDALDDPSKRRPDQSTAARDNRDRMQRMQEQLSGGGTQDRMRAMLQGLEAADRQQQAEQRRQVEQQRQAEHQPRAKSSKIAKSSGKPLSRSRIVQCCVNFYMARPGYDRNSTTKYCGKTGVNDYFKLLEHGDPSIISKRFKGCR